MLIVAAAGALVARPALAQMQHDMSTMSPGWTWTAAGQAFLNLNLQHRKFDDINRVESQNWFMGTAARSTGRGRLMLHAMFSAEPWTFHQSGSAQVFQSGETYNGSSLIDYQHPHDLVVSASGRFEWPVSTSWRFIAAGGAVDAPALGPEPFMHRASAEANPTAPLGHHHLDSTHITHGVITLGATNGAVTIEGSAFHGREPDEDRVAIEIRSDRQLLGARVVAARPLAGAGVGGTSEVSRSPPSTPTTTASPRPSATRASSKAGRWPGR